VSLLDQDDTDEIDAPEDGDVEPLEPARARGELCEICDEAGTPVRPLVLSRDVAGRAELLGHRDCVCDSALREPAWRKLSPSRRAW